MTEKLSDRQIAYNKQCGLNVEKFISKYFVKDTDYSWVDKIGGCLVIEQYIFHYVDIIWCLCGNESKEYLLKYCDGMKAINDFIKYKPTERPVNKANLQTNGY